MTRRLSPQSSAATVVQKVVRGHLARQGLKQVYDKFIIVADEISQEVCSHLAGYRTIFEFRDHRLLYMRDELNGTSIFTNDVADAQLESPPNTSQVERSNNEMSNTHNIKTDGGTLRSLPLETLIAEAERLEQALFSRIKVINNSSLDPR